MIKSILTTPALVFLITFLIIAIPLFFFNITIFDGEIVLKQGVKEISLPIKLSLSYFIGIGINPSDLKDIQGFHLISKGYFLAACLLLGFPSLMAYRSYLAKRGI
ncbi:MAG: hypothetical protein ACKOXP_01695 [Flavobacteriales bacterium]